MTIVTCPSALFFCTTRFIATVVACSSLKLSFTQFLLFAYARLRTKFRDRLEVYSRQQYGGVHEREHRCHAPRAS